MYRLTDTIIEGRTAECDLWEIEPTLAAWLPQQTDTITRTVAALVRKLADGNWTIAGECAYLGIWIEMTR